MPPHPCHVPWLLHPWTQGEKETYLSAWNGELLLALFALSGFVVFQPSMALKGAVDMQFLTFILIIDSQISTIPSHYTFRALLTSLKSSILSLDLEIQHKNKPLKQTNKHEMVLTNGKHGDKVKSTDWLRCSPISCRACSCCSHVCCSCCFSFFKSCSSCNTNSQETNTMLDRIIQHLLFQKKKTKKD